MPQPSSTLTSISQLSAVKKKKRPESSEPPGTTEASPTLSLKSRKWTCVRKRSSLRQSTPPPLQACSATVTSAKAWPSIRWR